MNRALSILVVALYLCVVSTAPAFGETSAVATAFVVEGSVSVREERANEWKPLAKGMPVREGDTIKTGDDGRAALEFVDGAFVRLGRSAAITINEVSPLGEPQVTQTAGRSYFFSRGARREPKIKTPLVNATIRGTELVVVVTPDLTSIDVLHGSAAVSDGSHEEVAVAGEGVTAKRGEPLTKSILVRPADAVQWMIRFPFIVTSYDLAPSSDSECSTACVEAIKHAIERAGSSSLLHEVESLPAGVRELPRGRILNALALWSVGDKASALKVLQALPAHLAARDAALQSLLYGYSALAESNPSAAEEYLAKAEGALPGLVNAMNLRSYIRQARGDVDGALEVARQNRIDHVSVAPLYDREAEMLLSSDRAEEAQALLATRTSRFGESAMSSTLAGFAALSARDFEEAQQHFNTALVEDSSLPLPYVGNALVAAQYRDYGSAQKSLSQAIQMDPSVAVYRSYLGKLFFENESSPKALQEFDAAVELDPLDPTPFLYRSYARVAENDPIGALEDVERSVELNDGRAVFRSSLLVDKDTAVRSAGLARTFNELGFSQAARLEAIKALNDDYSNYSAHRLLADSYLNFTDLDARLSEQRIADILSPLTFNIFNSLGETNSLGDYNSLFDKKETRKATDLSFYSNTDQWYGSLLATGKGEKYGYLLNYQPDFRNGTRRGSYYNDNIFRGAVQYQVSPDDRLILDNYFRVRETEGETDADYSEDFHLGRSRLGYNHRISPNAMFVSQTEYVRNSQHTHVDTERYVDALNTLTGETQSGSFGIDQSLSDRLSWSSMSNQLLYTSRYVDSVFGVDGLYADTSRREDSPVTMPGDLPAPADIDYGVDSNLTSGSVYEYLSFKVPRQATLTLGVKAARLERSYTEIPPYVDDTIVDSGVKPKIGLVLTPNSWLTGRVAYFEELRKSLLEDFSSLEPTLVGGINQRFNDISGTDSRNFGVGLDAKEADVIYGGMQYTRRHLLESVGNAFESGQTDGLSTTLTQEGDGIFSEHSESDILKGYVYTVLSRQSVLTADTLYERFRRTSPDSIVDIATQRYRLAYRHFYGKHIITEAGGTYRVQQFEYADDSGGFWLFDVGAAYRFSEQHGRFFARVDNILDRGYGYDNFQNLDSYLYNGRSVLVGISYNFF